MQELALVLTEEALMSDLVLSLTLTFTEHLQRLKGSPQGLPAEIAFWIPPVADRDSEAYFALDKPNWEDYRRFLVIALEICDGLKIAPAVTSIGAEELRTVITSTETIAATITRIAKPTTSAHMRVLLAT